MKRLFWKLINNLIVKTVKIKWHTELITRTPTIEVYVRGILVSTAVFSVSSDKWIIFSSLKEEV